MTIAFKGAIRDYFLLTASRTVSNTYAQVARAESCANQVQHVLRGTWSEGTAQLLRQIIKSHLLELYLIGWTIKPMKDDLSPHFTGSRDFPSLTLIPAPPARLSGSMVVRQGRRSPLQTVES